MITDKEKKAIGILRDNIQRLSLGDTSGKIEIPQKEEPYSDLFIALKLLAEELKKAERNRQELEDIKVKSALIVEEDKRRLLENQNELLGEEVKKKTFELEELFAKEKRNMEEISNLKDQFIFIAAHDLKTPVTVIGSYLDMIMNKKDVVEKIKKTDHFLIEALSEINRAKDHLKNLIADLLNVARIGAGKLQLSYKTINPIDVINKTVKNLSLLGKDRNISLLLSTKGAVPSTISTDPDRLVEVITNLISNAVKYNKDNGEVVVTLSNENEKLWIEVSDSGIGLSEEQQTHLFQKFWRAGDASGVEGTGLGLFIVKYIIDAMGGTIDVKSEKGKGTTFKFFVPIVKK